MKFLKRFLLVILGLVAVALIAALFVKKEYSLAKEITINRPKQQVYDYISLLKNQNNYGTWFKADPKMKQTYTGTDGTVGYVSAWESETMGNGQQQITELKNGESMKTAMVFKGFINFKSEASMNLKGVNDSVTNVNWTMSGSTPWPFNLMNVFMNMEDAVGKDYTQGLANLKSILEK
jgi:uncharacterized membrane protein